MSYEERNTVEYQQYLERLVETMHEKTKMHFSEDFHRSFLSRANDLGLAELLIVALKGCETPAEVYDLYTLIFGTTLWQETYAEMRGSGNAPIIRALEYIIINQKPQEKELFDAFIHTVEEIFPGFRQLAMKRFATVM